MITVVIVAIVVLAILVIAAMAWRSQRRSSQLQDRFGPEYDRTVESTDDKKAAERELAQRASRRDELEIRDLSPAEATRYREEWFGIQQRFVDAPGESVSAARALIMSAMRGRGYPTDSSDDREAMLSVDHAEVVQRYRDGVAVEERCESGDATTEDLRQAMKHYRAVFETVVGDAGPVIDVRDGSAYGDGVADRTPEQAPVQSGVSARRGTPADPAG